jgi:NADH:ubiquinone oxidoreductase subunit E
VSPLELPGAGRPYEILEEAEVARIQELRRRYPNGRSAVLPALWILQRRQGILTAEGMREVARALELPPGPVEAVASFYTMFFFKPHGRYVVEMCTSMSCLLNGAAPVLRTLEKELEVPTGGTSKDNFATLLEVECLGACGGAPAAQVNHRFFENLSPEKASALVAHMRAGTVEALTPPAVAATDGKASLQEMPTGAEAAEDETLVDLANPGANRLETVVAGAAGSVVDLVKGQGLLLRDTHHPAERGYTEPAEPPRSAEGDG